MQQGRGRTWMIPSGGQGYCTSARRAEGDGCRGGPVASQLWLQGDWKDVWNRKNAAGEDWRWSDTWQVTSTAYSCTSAQKVTAAGVALRPALCMGQGVSRRSLGGMRHIFSAWPPPVAQQAVKKPCMQPARTQCAKPQCRDYPYQGFMVPFTRLHHTALC